MNCFQTLLQVKKPSETCSPPCSPAADSKFSTPKFIGETAEIERLTNENLELKNKVLELQNELKWIKINHKIEIKSQTKLERADESAVEKYNDLVFDNCILPLADKCKVLILRALDGLAKAEGEKIGKGVENAEKDEEICEFFRESCENTAALEEMNAKVKEKDREIKKHKEFIKTLKYSLENILVEHKKSKDLNKMHLKEIAELKKILAAKEGKGKNCC